MRIPVDSGRSGVLENLLQQRTDLWRGKVPVSPRLPVVASGFGPLDTALAAGGWPRGALVEILPDGAGSGDVELLLPALAVLAREFRWIVLVAPPWIPYAPAFAAGGVDPARLLLLTPPTEPERLWALEQALRSGVCGAVLAWPRRPTGARLRRLQLAAEAGGGIGFLFHSGAGTERFSPAALRLRVRRSDERLAVDILKQRQGRGGSVVVESRGQESEVRI
jgi:cell division inhibitor SulA/protein ImuA